MHSLEHGLSATLLLLSLLMTVGAQTPLHTIVGGPGDFLGRTVDGPGDVTGDGVDDVIVGAHGADPAGGGSGSAFVISGVDGTVWDTRHGSQALEFLGRCVAGVGDVNGDGIDDYLVAGYGWDQNATTLNVGRASVYAGGTRALIRQHTGAAAGDAFGFAACAVGDVNGDGRSDYAIASPMADVSGQNDAGKVEVFSGATGTVLWTQVGPGAGAQFGFSLAGVGDVDRNGVPDLLVGAPAHAPPGAGGVPLGLAGMVGLYSGDLGIPLVPPIMGSHLLQRMGWSVAQAGDVDLDGRADFTVGSPGGTGLFSPGQVQVYSGLTMTPIPHLTLGGNQPGDRFGEAVAFAGDADLDGRPDLLVGSPGHDASGPDAGRVQLFSGRTGAALYTVNGAVAGEEFGQGVAHAGFINGDPFPDVLVAAPSSIAQGACRLSVLSGVARPRTHLRLSVKVIDGTSFSQPATSAQIPTWIAEVNQIFARRTNVEFDLIETIIMVDPGTPTSWAHPMQSQRSAMEISAEQNPCRFHWRPDAVNVYLVESIGGAEGFGYFPWYPENQNDLVVVSFSSRVASTLAHELGHHLGLLHTHQNTIVSGGCTALPTPDDCVDDTPRDEDPAPCQNPQSVLNLGCHLNNLAARTDLSFQEKRLLFYDVMSYHHGTPASQPWNQGAKVPSTIVLSPGQGSRVHEYLSLRQNAHVGVPSPTITGVAFIPNGSSTAVVALGTNLPTAANVVLELGPASGFIDPGTASATSVRTVFPQLPPGKHCVLLRQNQKLLAFSGNVPPVHPTVQVTANAINSTYFALFTTSAAQTSFLLGIGSKGPPTSVSGILNPLQLASVGYPLLTLATDATGQIGFAFPTTGLPQGLTITLQTLELPTATTAAFSNAFELAFP